MTRVTFLNAWGYQGDNMNLPVANVESAISFYERTMSFVVESLYGDPPFAVLERDGIRIGLTENGGDPEQDGCAFQVDDVEAALNEFRSNGLQKELSDLKIENRDDGSSWKEFYIVAPDGLCYWIGERLGKSTA